MRNARIARYGRYARNARFASFARIERNGGYARNGRIARNVRNARSARFARARARVRAIAEFVTDRNLLRVLSNAVTVVRLRLKDNIRFKVNSFDVRDACDSRNQRVTRVLRG